MKILGIDPGLANTGFGFLAIGDDGTPLGFEYGIIKTEKDTPHAVRLATITADVKTLIDLWGPDCLAVESLFHGVNTSSVMGVAEARGAVIAAAAYKRVPVYNFTPQQAKLAVTGYGKADKRAVQEGVKFLLKSEFIPHPDHAADALAIAICRWQQVEGGAA